MILTRDEKQIYSLDVEYTSRKWTFIWEWFGSYFRSISEL